MKGFCTAPGRLRSNPEKNTVVVIVAVIIIKTIIEVMVVKLAPESLKFGQYSFIHFFFINSQSSFRGRIKISNMVSGARWALSGHCSCPAITTLARRQALGTQR